MNTQNLIDYRRFASIPHGEMCTWAAWVADLEETTPETEENEPRCDCGLGRVIDEYTELVAALERICLDSDTAYLGCADTPFCGKGKPPEHSPECVVRIAWDALARVRGEEN